MIFILSGEVESGKTTVLQNFVAEIRAQKIRLDGFLSLRVMDGNETAGYDLADIQEGESRPFLRRTGADDWQKVGPYYVLPGGLAQAEKIIRRSRETDFLIVDEIGPLELEGKGLWPFLKNALFNERRRILVVVRKSLLREFLKNLAPVRIKMIDGADAGSLGKIVNDIKNISVKIKFFAYFREIFEAKEKDVLLSPGARLREVLDLICDTPVRRAEIFAVDELKQHLVVMINGSGLPAATGLETGLKDGDVVSIFPLMGGG